MITILHYRFSSTTQAPQTLHCRLDKGYVHLCEDLEFVILILYIIYVSFAVLFTGLLTSLFYH